MKKTILAVLIALAAMTFSSCVVLGGVQDSGSTRTEKSKPQRPGSNNSSKEKSRSSKPDRPGNSNSSSSRSNSRSSKPNRP